MSGLPDTFACPWCGMSYPAKPVLVGKAVRCKGCRNGFVLQPDGVATKIQDPPASSMNVSAVMPAAGAQPGSTVVPAPAPAPAPAPRPVSALVPVLRSAPEPRPAPQPEQIEVVAVRRAPTPEPVSARSPPRSPTPSPTDQVEVLANRTTSPPGANPKSERVPKKKTEALKAARAQMSAQLAEITQKAANSEVAKREERKSERISKGEGQQPARAAARNAVLSGNGERQHRELQKIWLIVGLVAVVGLLLAVVLNLRSAVRSAIDGYAAPVPSHQNHYPVLGNAVRSRAWLASAPSMPSGPLLVSDLSDADFGPERPIELTPVQPVLAELKGLRLDPAMGMWLAPAELAKAQSLVAGKSGDEAQRLLTAAKLRHVPHAGVVKRLGLEPEYASILLDLLTGSPPREGEPFAQRMLDHGELPTRLVVRTFHGRSGSLLIDIGRPPYRAVQGAYTGMLMRIEGDRWPIGWRVLQLAQVK